MTVRAKLKLTCITRREFTQGYPLSTTLRFDCQYDTATPEGQRFAKATPSGHIELQVENPAALDQFVAGKDYYVDFTPAEG